MAFQNDIRDRVALVTGAGTGIGAAIARRLAGVGARVVLVGRRLDRIEALAHEIDGLPLKVDVSQEDEVRVAINSCRSAFGRLDILVNNAGVSGGKFESASAIDATLWDQIFAVNVRGTMLCIKHAVGLLTEQRGVIVNVASIAAIRPAPRHVAYGASKAAVLNLTKSIAEELGPLGIRVNAICPGSVDTPLFREMVKVRTSEHGGNFEDDIERRKKLTALNRLTTPEEVANGVLFLASPQSGTMTGSALIMDSGRTYAP